MAFYLDTSALVRLVVKEGESTALRRWLAKPGRSAVSSDLARTELIRAVRRGAPDLVVEARVVLESIDLIVMTTEVFETAALLDPAILRTLDSLHLAAALELGDELEGLVTYDDRLAGAAKASGVAVVAPS